MSRPLLLASLVSVGLVSCAEPPPPLLAPLPPLSGVATAAESRINGNVGSPEAPLAPQLSYGQSQPIGLAPPPGTATGGQVSLDFADTDIRAAVAQILGSILRVNYTIDPAVHGTVTFHTATPLTTSQLLPTLQALLAQNGATLLEGGGLYRVVPTSAATSGPGGTTIAGSGSLAGSADVSGSIVLQLRYAGAEDMAKVLQPLAGSGARVTADPGRNVLVITGDPAGRASLIELVRAFDVDILAGQSYALLPVPSGSAKDFAGSLQDAFRSQGGSALASVIRVVPMERMNALLVISAQPRYIEDARRIYALVQRARGLSTRSWTVYYLQNSRSNDVAYVLQQAFTPNNVTAQPSPVAQTAPGAGSQQVSGGAAHPLTGSSGGTGGIGGSGSGIQGGSSLFGGAGGGGPPSSGSTPGAAAPPAAASPGAGNPLLGGLDSGGGDVSPDTMRIIPNEQNNALLIYGTQREVDTVQAMLRKIDILPLQVRIDATIAEVTLNDQLQYGTQYFFKSGGINGVLSFAQSSLTGTLATAAFNTAFPGFVVGGTGNGGAPFAISALQAVTTVHVLSSPELLVLDNQPARLQVGNLVPYLSQTSQSTISTEAPVISSINYQQTGVIMQVTPRVNSGGLVTLDVAQEVSDVATGVTTPGINSPTFEERNVTSRVVVQDGQTVGLAGLIRDTVTRGNQGIPWLKDIPILGFLAGQQTNQRVRTELLVLITPHVIHDQRDARALTEDLRDQLPNAAAVPMEIQSLRPSGSADPGDQVRRKLKLQQ